MAWIDELPRMQAEREAWRAEHLPRVREREAMLAERRERVTDIVQRGMLAINATDEEKDLVFAQTGIVALAPQA